MEIISSLGSQHDGAQVLYASACPSSDNYIMAPSAGSTNLLNVYKFSSCSVLAFKAYMLTNSNSAVSNNAQCLTGSEKINVFDVLDQSPSGYFQFTARDQCKQKYGSAASFCTVNILSLCSEQLFC